MLENMQIAETLKRETDSKKEWAKQNASDKFVYQPETDKAKRLVELKEQVADLCDLQPTPASMFRPPRKVRLSPPAVHLPCGASVAEWARSTAAPAGDAVWPPERPGQGADRCRVRA